MNATSTLNQLEIMDHCRLYGINIEEVASEYAAYHHWKMILINLDEVYDIVYRSEINEWTIHKRMTDVAIKVEMDKESCIIKSVMRFGRTYRMEKFLKPYRNICEVVHGLYRDGYFN